MGNGELVVLKNSQGEKQTFLKKSKNLIWYLYSRSREPSAGSGTKRHSPAKHGNFYGSSNSNNFGSPTRNNGGSPTKKNLGWGQSP